MGLRVVRAVVNRMADVKFVSDTTVASVLTVPDVSLNIAVVSVDDLGMGHTTAVNLISRIKAITEIETTVTMTTIKEGKIIMDTRVVKVKVKWCKRVEFSACEVNYDGINPQIVSVL